MARVKYAGVPVNDLIVPALSIGQAEELDSLVSNLAAADGESRGAHAKRLIPLVAAALRRNYPDMSDEDVARDIDFDSLTIAVRAALALTATEKTRGE
jgi:hypothetical protein